VMADDRQLNSFAASTAALHFDEDLLRAIEEKGIQSTNVCLHIGLGTFAPIEVEETTDFKIHSEVAEVSDESWNEILTHKKAGGRIIAVGTTVVRTLESAARRKEQGEPIRNFEARLFIHPPFDFHIVDGLITNFHQPRTSLLLLVSAFTEPGISESDLKFVWKEIYRKAIDEKYRLFSYGDGILIL